MRAALAQINATVGDLAGNARLLADAARQAYRSGARLVLAPELALTGYPPEDLLLRPAFVAACAESLKQLAAELADCPGLHLVVGHPHVLPGAPDLRSKSIAVQQRFNAASVLTGGRVLGTYCKRELPNYQVFDERRYFVSGRDAGQGALVFDCEGLRFGLLICEDAWFDEPAQAAREAGAQVAMLGGIDLLAFTGGIGEHDPAVRAAVADALAAHGLRLDAARNAAACGSAVVPIHADDSTVEAWVVPSDEGRTAATAAFNCLHRPDRGTAC